MSVIFFLDLTVSTFRWTKNGNKLPLLDENVNSRPKYQYVSLD